MNFYCSATSSVGVGDHHQEQAILFADGERTKQIRCGGFSWPALFRILRGGFGASFPRSNSLAGRLQFR